MQDEYGSTERTTKGIMQAFTSFLQRKYEAIAVEEECVTHMVEAGRRIFSDGLERTVGSAHHTGGSKHCNEEREKE
jgi:hypothetical protein